MPRRGRKRSYSEEDGSVEQRYAQSQSKRKKEAGEDADSKEEDEKPAAADSSSKIDKLKLKKQRRKELQKAKADQKKRAEAARIEAERESQKALSGQKEQKKKQRQQEEKAGQLSFQTLRKGVQYLDVSVGKGPPVQDRKKVRVKYILRAKNRYGKVIDQSNSFPFRLGRGEVIEGWDIGVQGMRQGGRRYLIVPPEAGYDRKNVGAGVGGVLFFDVTVL